MTFVCGYREIFRNFMSVTMWIGGELMSYNFISRKLLQFNFGNIHSSSASALNHFITLDLKESGRSGSKYRVVKLTTL